MVREGNVEETRRDTLVTFLSKGWRRKADWFERKADASKSTCCRGAKKDGLVEGVAAQAAWLKSTHPN